MTLLLPLLAPQIMRLEIYGNCSIIRGWLFVVTRKYSSPVCRSSPSVWAIYMGRWNVFGCYGKRGCVWVCLGRWNVFGCLWEDAMCFGVNTLEMCVQWEILLGGASFVSLAGQQTFCWQNCDNQAVICKYTCLYLSYMVHMGWIKFLLLKKTWAFMKK